MPPFKRNNPGCPCCGCVPIFEDDGSGETLDPAWIGDTGDFAPSGGVIESTASDKHIRIVTTETNITVFATLKGTAAGDQLRLQARRTDADNLVYLEVEFQSGAGNGVVRIVERNAGSDLTHRECAVTAEPGTAYSVAICTQQQTSTRMAVAMFAGAIVATHGHLQTGNDFGIATGTLNGTATFDDISMEFNIQDPGEECPRCADCFWPNVAPLPSQIMVDLPAMDDDDPPECGAGACAGVAGSYTLDLQPDSLGCGSFGHDADLCACYKWEDSGGTCDLTEIYVIVHGHGETAVFFEAPLPRCVQVAVNLWFGGSAAVIVRTLIGSPDVDADFDGTSLGCHDDAVELTNTDDAHVEIDFGPCVLPDPLSIVITPLP